MKLEGEKLNCFQKVRDFAIYRMVPRAVLESDSLLFWRTKILATFWLSISIFCTFGIAASVFLIIKNDSWGLLLFDALYYAIAFNLMVLPGLSYEFRAITSLLLVYSVGFTVIIYVGPLSAGPIWLFAFAVFAGVLMGAKAAVAAVFLNAVTLMVLCRLISLGYFGRDFIFFKTPEAMAAALVNFIILNLISAILISVLVKGLNASNLKEKSLAASLAAEREHLVEANQRLGIEIEDRKLAHAAVRDSEQKYRLLADHISDVIWLMDLKQQHLTYVSPSVERIRGCTPEECMAQSLEQILTPASHSHAIQFINDQLHKDRRMLQGRAVSLEAEIYKKDRNAIWTETTVSLIRNSGHHPAMLLGVSRDITLRKHAEQEKIKLEDQLRQSKKMEAIGTLAGGIAHDFNNILSAIIGFTELGLDDAPEGSILSQNLEETYAAGKRAKELVRQILVFARQADNDLKPIQVSLIVKETLRFMRSTIPTSIQIESNIGSDSLIMGNPTQMHQIMINLCTNAAHAMEPDGGILAVGLADVIIGTPDSGPLPGMQPGQYVQLTVSDTGKGISPDIISSIFDPYFTTKAVGKGTGMGLAVVHGIVESYGGKIAVESTLNRGTVITVYLPVTMQDATFDDVELDAMPGGSERILLVDDETAIVNFGRQMLERLRYTVSTRTGSLEALALFRQMPQQFDLVITDLSMPNMTGTKLADELLAIRPDIPIILCTGYNDKIPKEGCEALGFKALAHKPIIRSDLARLIRQVLDEKKNTENLCLM